MTSSDAEPMCIDKEFLEMYKSKIQKMHKSSAEGKIAVSMIAKNHYYPCIGKSTAADAYKFFDALSMNGLGKILEDCGCKYFVFTDKENANADQLSLFKNLGIKL